LFGGEVIQLSVIKDAKHPTRIVADVEPMSACPHGRRWKADRQPLERTRRTRNGDTSERGVLHGTEVRHV
jgi:hypothetical protein